MLHFTPNNDQTIIYERVSMRKTIFMSITPQHFLVTILLCLISALSYAKSSHENANKQWLTDMDEAQKIAQKENKDILMLYTGTDWCVPCRILHEKVFENDIFITYAKDNLILVELDFPADDSKLSEKQKEHNQKWLEIYPPKGYPSVYLTNASAKRYAKVESLNNDPTAYINNVSQTQADYKVKTKVTQLVKETQGLENARYLDLLLSLPSTLTMENKRDKIDKIIALTKEKTSLQKKYIEIKNKLVLKDELNFIGKEYNDVKYSNNANKEKLLKAAKELLKNIDKFRNKVGKVKDLDMLRQLILLDIDAHFDLGQSKKAKQMIEQLINNSTYTIEFKQSFAEGLSQTIASYEKSSKAGIDLCERLIAMDPNSDTAKEFESFKEEFYDYLKTKE